MKYLPVAVSMLWLTLAFATVLSFVYDAPKIVLIILAWFGGIVSARLYDGYRKAAERTKT